MSFPEELMVAETIPVLLSFSLFDILAQPKELMVAETIPVLLSFSLFDILAQPKVCHCSEHQPRGWCYCKKTFHNSFSWFDMRSYAFMWLKITFIYTYKISPNTCTFVHDSGNLFYQKSTTGTTIVAIEANKDTYCLKKWTEKFPLIFLKTGNSRM